LGAQIANRVPRRYKPTRLGYEVGLPALGLACRLLLRAQGDSEQLNSEPAPVTRPRFLKAVLFLLFQLVYLS
jgi:hypothetical protein